MPWGVVEEDTGQLSLTCGSAAKTRDCSVAAVEARWQALPAHEQRAPARLQLRMDNGPESSGVRTQFLHRLVQFADQIGKPVQLLYSPPSHSNYNPIERGWGIVELPGHGTLLREVDPRLAGAQRMMWKGRPPVGELSHKE
jgi:hypothetical protein